MKTTSKIKFELWVLNLILFSGIFVGCGIPANESVVPEQPPELQVIYQTNESELSYDIKILCASRSEKIIALQSARTRQK